MRNWGKVPDKPDYTAKPPPKESDSFPQDELGTGNPDTFQVCTEDGYIRLVVATRGYYIPGGRLKLMKNEEVVAIFDTIQWVVVLKGEKINEI